MLKKMNSAREAREKNLGCFRRFTGENAQKGVQKVLQIWCDFLKRKLNPDLRLLRFLEKIKPRFEIAEISGKNKTPF